MNDTTTIVLNDFGGSGQRVEIEGEVIELGEMTLGPDTAMIEEWSSRRVKGKAVVRSFRKIPVVRYTNCRRNA